MQHKQKSIKSIMMMSFFKVKKLPGGPKKKWNIATDFTGPLPKSMPDCQKGNKSHKNGKCINITFTSTKSKEILEQPGTTQK